MPGQGRLGDKASVQLDAHGCPACPHPGTGPAIVGSFDVNVNRRPALRVDDTGVHAACCGLNTWRAERGCLTVLINGKSAFRMQDPSRHCGGSGALIEGSPNVIVGEDGGSGARTGAPPGLAPGPDTGFIAQATSPAAPAAATRSRTEPSAQATSEPMHDAAGDPPSGAAGRRPGDAAHESPNQPPAESPVVAVPPDQRSWIEIYLVGEDGSPIANERYIMTPMDGVRRTGVTGSDGGVRLDGLDPGSCTVTFPDLDAAAWEPIAAD